MDPVTLLILSSFVGGLFLALWLARANRRSTKAGQAVAPGDGLITDAMNMAHIRVAGVGGLGFVAVAVVVAAFIPSIGVALAIGLASGTIFAVVLTLWRRRAGPLTSSGRRPGANTTLSIETAESPSDNRANDRTNSQQSVLVTALPKHS